MAIIIQKYLGAYENIVIPAVNNNGNIVDFNGSTATESFN